MAGEVLCGKYRLVRKIGTKLDEQVYAGVDDETKEIAVKLEPKRSINQKVFFESVLYRRFNDDGGRYVPRVICYGETNKYNFLVIDLLGPSLQELYESCSRRRFSLKTVLMLADQMISCVEYVHSKSIIHRNIKPGNFVMGRRENDRNQVYIIDFADSKVYRNRNTGKHIELRETGIKKGNQKFASLNSNRGLSMSRRDDLESLGFTLVYLLGALAWNHVSPLHSYRAIIDIFIKHKKSIPNICRNSPDVFVKYFEYVRGLEFDETPDYNYLRKLFSDALVSNNFQHDFKYDWVNEFELLKTDETVKKSEVVNANQQNVSEKVDGKCEANPDRKTIE